MLRHEDSLVGGFFVNIQKGLCKACSLETVLKIGIVFVYCGRYISERFSFLLLFFLEP